MSVHVVPSPHRGSYERTVSLFIGASNLVCLRLEDVSEVEG